MNILKKPLSMIIAIAMILSVCVLPSAVFAANIALKANVAIGESYILPATYNNVAITWNSTGVDTSKIGVQTFTGTCGSDTVTLTLNVGYYESIIKEDMESYDAGAKPALPANGGMSVLSANTSIAFDNGVSGNKVYKIGGTTRSTWPTAANFDGLSLPEAYTGNFRVSFDMRFENPGTHQTKAAYISVLSDYSKYSSKNLGGIYIRRANDSLVNVRNLRDGTQTGTGNGKNVKQKDFPMPKSNWFTITMVFDADNKKYDVFAESTKVLADIPYDFDVNSAKYILFSVGSDTQTSYVHFDNINFEKLVTVKNVPTSLDVTIPQGDDTAKEFVSTLPVTMSDDSVMNFAVKYTANTNPALPFSVDGTVDGFSSKIPVNVTVMEDTATVTGITSELSATRYIGQSFTLPNKLSVTYSDSTSGEADVSWEPKTVDVTTIGVKTFTGRISGYDNPVTYTLTVKEDVPVSVDDLVVNVLRNQTFSLPEFATANMESGAKKIYTVNWGSQSADTTVSGTYNFTGTIDGDIDVYLTLNVSDQEFGVTYLNELVGKDTTYTLPAKLEGRAITWNNGASSVDTTYVGNQIFTGKDSDGARYNFTVNVGESTLLVADDMQSYQLNSQPSYELPGGVGGLALLNNCFIAQDPEDSNNLVTKMDTVTTWGDFELITPDMPANDCVVSGRVYVDGTITNDGAKLILQNLAGNEIGGIVFYQKTSEGIINIRSGRNDSRNANTGSGESGVDGISYSAPRWIDFKIVVDVSNLTYDIYADSLTIRKNVPVTSTAITSADLASVKTITIANRTSNSVGDIYFDDFAITEHTYVTEKLPDTLSDNVVVMEDNNADRTQSIYLMQNNGERREFTVNYTVDLSTSGTQYVDGTIDGFTGTISVEVQVDSRTIQSIANIEEEVYVGADYVLPATVTAVLSDNSEKELNITWEQGALPDTNSATPDGEPQVFTGTVAGWDSPVTLTLTVIDDAPESAEDIFVTVKQYDNYVLPEKVTVALESGTTTQIEADWNGEIAKTNTIGEFIYNGIVNDNANISVTLTLNVEAAAITGYRDSEIEILVESVEKLPKTVACVFENEAIAQVDVAWDTSTIGEGFGPHTITGTVEGFAEPITANVKIIDFPEAALNDGLDTMHYDTDFHDKKFEHGMSLRLAPFSSGNYTGFKSIYDPTSGIDDVNNLVMNYRCSLDFPGNYNKHYETITMEEGKGGYVLMEMDMWMPYDFTEFRVRLLSGGGGEVVVLNLKGKDRLISSTKGAFPVEEWFRLGILTDSSALADGKLSDDEKGTYSFYINGVLIEEGLEWRGTPTQTNQLGTNIKSINFANREDDVFSCYLDNANLYFFNDDMKAAMESIEYIPDTDPDETFYNDYYDGDGNLELPTSYDDGTTITWSSNRHDVIGNDGTIYYPAFGSNNKGVVMTATFSKMVGDIQASEKIPYLFRVFPRAENAADNALIALNSIALPSSVTEDINLPTEVNDIAISWSSNKPNVLDNKGRVFNPDTNTVVTLTASTHSGASRSFNITVIHQSSLTDIQKVRSVMDSVTIPSSTSTSLTLQTSVDGVNITWISSNISVMSNEGAIGRGNFNTDVILTARFSYGAAVEEKKFTVRVSVSNQNSYENSSSSSSSGGKYASDAKQQTETIPTVPMVSNSSVFKDIAGYDWAHEAIDSLYQKGIINGVSADSYMPAANILREQYAALIVRLLKLESNNDSNIFTDVNENDWFCKEINIAYQNGIISGIGNNMAGTGYNITREDMAVILYNAAKTMNMAGTAKAEADFADFDEISGYAKEAISFLSEKGVINGSDGKMLPKNYVTRAEAAKMIYEFIRIFDVENAQINNNDTENDIKTDDKKEENTTDDSAITHPEEDEEIEEVDSMENQNEMDSMNDSLEQSQDTLQKEEEKAED